jgi:hypothetical protein
MPWALHWEGDVYREADITLGQAERIENLIGTGWLRLNVIATAKHAKATLAVMVADRTGRPLDEVLAEVDKIPANTYASDVFHVEDDDLPTEYLEGNPPKAAARSTSSRRSSGSRRTAGPQT